MLYFSYIIYALHEAPNEHKVQLTILAEKILWTRSSTFVYNLHNKVDKKEGEIQREKNAEALACYFYLVYLKCFSKCSSHLTF